jgi:exodeoxyribonuclease X
MRIRVIDLETTGTQPDAGVCEVGYCDLTRTAEGVFQVGDPNSFFTDPGKPIPPEAAAVHHITDEMVFGARAFGDACAELLTGDDIVMFGAHNVRFEQTYFDGGDKPWACSLKAAYRLWPDAPSHKLQVLRYWLKLDEELDFNPAHVLAPHRAGADAYLGALILRRQFLAVGGKQVAQWTRDPALQPRITFGKHANMKWADVPDGYIEWLINKATDLDDDILDTARHHAFERGII